LICASAIFTSLVYGISGIAEEGSEKVKK
jgi:hypothetical protein